MKLRRTLAGFLAVMVFAMSSIYPAREAKAVIPFAGLALALLNTAGAVISSDALLAAGTTILGSMAAAAIFLIPGDTSSNAVRVPLSNNTAVTSPAIPAPVAPSSTSPIERWLGGGSYHSSFGSACIAAVAFNSAPPEPYSRTARIDGMNCWMRDTYTPNGSYSESQIYLSHTSECPSGYQFSGNNCVVSNPAQVIPREVTPDRNVDLYVNASGGLSWHPDKDVPPANTSFPGGAAGGKIWGTNSAGQPFVTTITPRADGGTDISTQTQISSAGNSFVQTSNISLAASTHVTGASSNTVPGTVGDVTGSTVPVVTTTPNTSSPIVFPDDYARQVTTLGTLIQTTKIADALTVNATGVTDPSIPASIQFTDNFFKDTFTNILGWSPPAHTSTCPTSSFDALGNTYTFDAHCALVNENFNSIRQAMTVCYLLMALFIVLKA